MGIVGVAIDRAIDQVSAGAIDQASGGIMVPTVTECTT